MCCNVLGKWNVSRVSLRKFDVSVMMFRLLKAKMYQWPSEQQPKILNWRSAGCFPREDKNRFFILIR